MENHCSIESLSCSLETGFLGEYSQNCCLFKDSIVVVLILDARSVIGILIAKELRIKFLVNELE